MLSMSSSLRLMSASNFPSIVAWNVPATSGFHNFSWSNLSFDWVGFLVFIIRTQKVIIPKSRSLPMSVPGELLALIPRKDKVNLVVMLPVWAVSCHLLDSLCGHRVFVSTRMLQAANF